MIQTQYKGVVIKLVQPAITANGNWECVCRLVWPDRFAETIIPGGFSNRDSAIEGSITFARQFIEHAPHAD